MEFQSTPPAEARGDVRKHFIGTSSFSFNPLPPPKRGETPSGPPPVAGVGVSIHSPRRSEGRQPTGLLNLRTL